MEFELFLKTYLIYTLSILYYQYNLSTEIQTIEIMKLSRLEQIKILFLSGIGIIPIVNTFICLLIMIYKIKEYRKSKSSKYE